MSVHDSTVELFKSFKIWHVGSTEMPRGNDNIIEFFGPLYLIGIHFFEIDSKLLGILVKSYHFYSSTSSDPILAIVLVESCKDIL